MATSIKKINGKEYLYYHYYENGRKKDVYCGPASKPESKRKAIELEIMQLKEQKNNIAQKISEMQNLL